MAEQHAVVLVTVIGRVFPYIVHMPALRLSYFSEYIYVYIQSRLTFSKSTSIFLWAGRHCRSDVIYVNNAIVA